MNALDLIRRGQRQTATRDVSPEPTLWLADAFAGAGTYSGKTVTVERSLELDVVLACARLLSESVGSLPLRVYQRQQNAMVEAWSLPVSRLLRDEPNPEMTGVDFWTQVMLWLSLWGNAYVGKEFDSAGRVQALWPIHPQRVRVGRDSSGKVYRVRSETGADEQVFRGDVILHFRGISVDGLVGISPVGLMREAVGAGVSMDEFSASFFQNSAVPRGLVKLQGTMSDTAFERFRARWNALFRGTRNAHRVAVLEGGADFIPVTMPLDDAQFIEQGKMTGQKLCRGFRVPPEMVGLDSGSSLTYSTVEGQGQHFERYSLRPWRVRIAETLNRDRDLFPGADRAVFCEFDVAPLLEADVKTRAEVTALALDPVKGWMKPNEARRDWRLPADPSFDIPTAPAPVPAASDPTTNGAV